MKNEERWPYTAAPRRRLKRITFPRFEDVTRAEAREISKDAPRSAWFQRERAYSLVGSAAALCALETK